jgi:hypothetical protein
MGVLPEDWTVGTVIVRTANPVVGIARWVRVLPAYRGW